MPPSLDAAAVAVRLRRLWLTDVRRCDALAASDLADAALEVGLRRLGSTLLVRTPYDFGRGDPFDGPLGEHLRHRVRAASGGAVDDVAWEYDERHRPVKDRDRSADTDVFAPGDPPPEEWPSTVAALRSHVPAPTPDAAREVLARLRLVAVSRHRLWLAAPSVAARDELGSVIGARAALVTAVQAVQRAERPLYRVVVDASYRAKGVLLTTT